MQRSYKRIPIGTTQTRHMVTLVGEPVLEGGIDKRRKQVDLLRSMADQIELLNCGPEPFERLKMQFVGNVWVVEMEATTEGQ